MKIRCWKSQERTDFCTLRINLQYSWINMVCVWFEHSWFQFINIYAVAEIAHSIAFCIWDRLLLAEFSVFVCTNDININYIDIWHFSNVFFLFFFQHICTPLKLHSRIGEIVALLKEEKNPNTLCILWFHAIFGFQWHRVQCCSTAAIDEGLHFMNNRTNESQLQPISRNWHTFNR